MRKQVLGNRSAGSELNGFDRKRTGTKTTAKPRLPWTSTPQHPRLPQPHYAHPTILCRTLPCERIRRVSQTGKFAHGVD
jgi:hypothetical protein